MQQRDFIGIRVDTIQCQLDNRRHRHHHCCHPISCSRHVTLHCLLYRRASSPFAFPPLHGHRDQSFRERGWLQARFRFAVANLPLPVSCVKAYREVLVRVWQYRIYVTFRYTERQGKLGRMFLFVRSNLAILRFFNFASSFGNFSMKIYDFTENLSKHWLKVGIFSSVFVFLFKL